MAKLGDWERRHHTHPDIHPARAKQGEALTSAISPSQSACGLLRACAPMPDRDSPTAFVLATSFRQAENDMPRPQDQLSSRGERIAGGEGRSPCSCTAVEGVCLCLADGVGCGARKKVNAGGWAGRTSTHATENKERIKLQGALLLKKPSCPRTPPKRCHVSLFFWSCGASYDTQRDNLSLLVE